MKYFHKFDSYEDFEEAYGDVDKTSNSAEWISVSGVTLYYDEEISRPNSGFYYFIDESGQWDASASTRNPASAFHGGQVQFGAVGGEHDWQNVDDFGYPEPTQGTYSEPWISWIDGYGRYGVNYNHKIRGVDLGLPSGLIWASCNIGAKNPWEVGDFFAWGEVAPKSAYTWENYRYYDNSNEEFTKYGNVDNKWRLDKSDDAAAMILGGGWRMPTKDECDELDGHTSDRFGTILNGVEGMCYEGNGNTLFMPKWGSMSGTTQQYISDLGRYWISDLGDDSHPYMYGWCQEPYASAYLHDESITRQLGCPIRAVREPLGYGNNYYGWDVK